MDNVYVRLMKLPDKVYGFTMPGVDGMNIYIDEGLNREMQLKVYRHELDHIRRNDFQDPDVQADEREVHEGRK